MTWNKTKKLWKQTNFLLILTTISVLLIWRFAVSLYVDMDKVATEGVSFNTGALTASGEQETEGVKPYCDSKCKVEQEIREIAEREGFERIDWLVELAKCESSLNQFAVGDGDYESRGVWQISSYFHPMVSDETAFSVELSTLWTLQQIEYGNEWLWTCSSIINEE